MDENVLTREEMAQKIVKLRNLRLDIEKLKIKAKQKDVDKKKEFTDDLSSVEHNYDLFKEKLTEFAVREDDELSEVGETLDTIWQDLHASIEKMTSHVKS